jgi:hypothetical protein
MACDETLRMRVQAIVELPASGVTETSSYTLHDATHFAEDGGV